MIRESLALTAGIACEAVAMSGPVRYVRRVLISIELRLCLNEIVDVCDDITDAMRDRDMLLAEGLTDFYTELCCHRDALRVKLHDLS